VSSQELLQQIELVLGSSKDMAQGTISRRHVLELLVSLSAGLLSGMNPRNTFEEEDVVTLSAASIPACWNLFFAGEFLQVEQSLSTYFSQLTPLAQRASHFQRSAATLLSQVHQIASLLVWEREDFGSSLAHCKQASQYGSLAGDPNLQAAALIRQANTLFYRKRHMQIQQTYQEAIQYVADVSPLIKGRIYLRIQPHTFCILTMHASISILINQSEAQSLYDHMQAKWPHEKNVKELVDLFHQ
jgi:hypothetical protein